MQSLSWRISSRASRRSPWWEFDHPSQMPGVVVEPLFVTNPLEDGIVASQASDQAIAQGIAEAVESFVAGAAPR